MFWHQNCLSCTPPLVIIRKATNTAWALTYYLYDGDNEIGEYSAVSSVANNTYTTSPYLSSLFFNGVNIDEPIATWKFNDSSNKSQVYTRYIFIPDSLGSNTALSGALKPGDGQTTIASYAYDSYGNLAAICGGDTANQNLLRYTAREYTPLPAITSYSQLPNSLYHFRHRTADVQLGAFYQQDPKWYPNLYPYVDGNPISNIDPMGEDVYVIDNNNHHLELVVYDPKTDSVRAVVSAYPREGDMVKSTIANDIDHHFTNPNGTYKTDFDMNKYIADNTDLNFMKIDGLEEDEIVKWANTEYLKGKWSILERTCIGWVEAALQEGGSWVDLAPPLNWSPSLAFWYIYSYEKLEPFISSKIEK